MPVIDEWLEQIRSTAPFGPAYYHGALLSEKYPHMARLKEKARKEAPD